MPDISKPLSTYKLQLMRIKIKRRASKQGIRCNSNLYTSTIIPNQHYPSSISISRV